MTLALGPPGSHVRQITPLVPYTANMWVPPSAIAHRRELWADVGPWLAYQEAVEPPDMEFLHRAVASGRGLAQTGALTVIKFNSAWRRDSYLLRLDAEQAAFSRRLGRPRALIAREVALYAFDRLRRVEPVLPQLEPQPDVLPPGWHVRQYRMIRGLDPDPPGLAARSAGPPPPRDSR